MVTDDKQNDVETSAADDDVIALAEPVNDNSGKSENVAGETEKKKKNEEKKEKKCEKKKSCFIKKFFKFLFFFLIILIIVLGLVVVFRDAIVKNVVPTVGKWAVGVDIHIGEFETSIVQGRVRIAGLEISNPNGYEKEHLLSLGEAVVDLKPNTLLTQNIIFEEVTVNDLLINAEVARDGKLNFVKLNEYVQKKFPPQPEDSDDKEEISDEPESGNEITVLIENFKLKGKFVVIDDRISLSIPFILSYSEKDLTSNPDFDISFAEEFEKLTNFMQTLVNSIIGAGVDISGSAQKIFDSTMSNAGSIWDSSTKGINKTLDQVKKFPKIFKFGSDK